MSLHSARHPHKRVSVRLAAVGGRQVRAELEGVGEAGSRGFGRLSREMEAANARLAGFARRVRVAAAAAVAAATAAGVAMVRSGLQTVDAQAKLAQSLGTTVASIQTLERAGELAGVSMSGIEQATKDLTRRLSQAAAGTGPAADALDRLGLSANELIALPLDQRVGAINAAIEELRARRRTRRRGGAALRRGRLHRHVADRHRDAAPGDRGRAPSVWSSPSRMPTRSNARTTRSPGSG
jgi:hypothetical protein